MRTSIAIDVDPPTATDPKAPLASTLAKFIDAHCR